MKLILILGSLITFSVHAENTSNYPKRWWKKIPESQRKSWEKLPQDAKPGQVILSKRTELGIFSNLSLAPFRLDGESYSSVEALWQMMKYPDPQLADDPRFQIDGWPYKRYQLKYLHGFKAKKAGDAVEYCRLDRRTRHARVRLSVAVCECLIDVERKHLGGDVFV